MQLVFDILIFINERTYVFSLWSISLFQKELSEYILSIFVIRRQNLKSVSQLFLSPNKIQILKYNIPYTDCKMTPSYIQINWIIRMISKSLPLMLVAPLECALVILNNFIRFWLFFLPFIRSTHIQYSKTLMPANIYSIHPNGDFCRPSFDNILLQCLSF